MCSKYILQKSLRLTSVMSLKLTYISAAGVAIAIAAVAQPAQAAIVAGVSRINSRPDDATLINFNSFQPITIDDTNTPFDVNNQVTITATDGRAEIRAGNNNPNNRFVLLGRGGSFGGEATFTFNVPNLGLDYLGFTWGGDRDGDSVQFFFGDDLNAAPIATFTGADINGLNGVDDGSAEFITFEAENPSDIWDRVVFFEGDTSGSFRIDNLAYRQVPTPALLPGLIGMGVAAFRKKQQQPECAEA